MRIAIVHPYSWPEVRRGAERYLEDLSGYLSGTGHEVVVVTGTHDRPSVVRRDDGVKVVRRPQIEPGLTRRMGLTEVDTFGIRAFRPLSRWRPDVAHAFTPSGALAARAARLATLYTILGHPAPDQMPASAIQRRLFTSAVASATVTAALSAASADSLRSMLGRQAVVLPPGVDLERFPLKLAPRKGPPRILFSASLADHRKRADVAVGVLALVLERHPDARLALSGEGDPSWVLDAAIHSGKQVRDAIDVLGPGKPEEVPSRYRESTLTLLPADHEAFGLALVESLACGTPAVCAPMGGMPEILADPKVGRVAAGSDAASLAHAVEETIGLAAEHATPESCVKRAQSWSWLHAVGPAHERIYERVAGVRSAVASVEDRGVNFAASGGSDSVRRMP